jgi:putative FmdB family regulatory protein
LTRFAAPDNLNIMPIFEYRCDQCGSQFELLVRSDTVIACPSCEGRRVSKLFSVPARPAGSAAVADYSSLGPPAGGCCGGGGCGCH